MLLDLVFVFKENEAVVSYHSVLFVQSLAYSPPPLLLPPHPPQSLFSHSSSSLVSHHCPRSLYSYRAVYQHSALLPAVEIWLSASMLHHQGTPRSAGYCGQVHHDQSGCFWRGLIPMPPHSWCNHYPHSQEGCPVESLLIAGQMGAVDVPI